LRQGPWGGRRPYGRLALGRRPGRSATHKCCRGASHPDHFSMDLYVEAVALRFLINFLLGFGEFPDLRCNALDDGPNPEASARA
jgi:hypothetical protein